MNNDNANVYGLSNAGIFKMIGDFVKQTRINKHLTQAELATKAGLNRTTISLFEAGEKGNIETLIRIMRALEKLQFFEQLDPRFNIDPLANIDLEKKRSRTTKHK